MISAENRITAPRSYLIIHCQVTTGRLLRGRLSRIRTFPGCPCICKLFG